MTGVSSPSEPPPYGKPPRSAMSMRDMVGAILVLLPVVLIAGGLSQCSFNPGGPAVDPGLGPTVDAPAELRALAPSTPFDLRVPGVPPGWRANAVNPEPVADGRLVSTGYITGAGRYVRLVQSDAPAESVLAAVGGPAPATGTVEVGGAVWTVFAGPDREPIWLTEVDGVALLVTGSAAEPDFRTLAAATLA